MVSVTIGHGTSLMAPSNIRNTMTRAERMRPAQRSGLEAGRVSVTVMTNPRCLEWWLGFKTNEAGGSRQESGIFYFVMAGRSEEHTSELQSHSDLVCRLLLEKKKRK